MIPFLFLTLASFQPMFPLSGFPADSSKRHIVPPRKTAYFDSGNQTYEVAWAAKQHVKVELFVPSRLGYFASDVDNISVSIEASNCILPVVSTEAGNKEYEPLYELELQSVTTIGNLQPQQAGSCILKITTKPHDARYVLQSGTQSAHPGTLYGVGLPIHIMFTSTWAQNYIYGYALLVCIPALFLWHAASPWHLSVPYKIALLVLLCSAVSRGWQVATAGFGAGQLLAVLPLLLAAFACKASREPALGGLVVAIAVVSPTRSWLDVIALSIAAALNG